MSMFIKQMDAYRMSTYKTAESIRTVEMQSENEVEQDEERDNGVAA